MSLHVVSRKQGMIVLVCKVCVHHDLVIRVKTSAGTMVTAHCSISVARKWVILMKPPVFYPLFCRDRIVQYGVYFLIIAVRIF